MSVSPTAAHATALGFDPLPAVPPGLGDAAMSGELVVFVGAGISRLVGCPDWHGFADRVLEQLAPLHIDYYELGQIQSIRDPKRRLSIAKIIADKAGFKIDFEAALVGRPPKRNVYDWLNKFRCSFVTTNYDRNLNPVGNPISDELSWRFEQRSSLLGSNLDRPGNVVHLHGCVSRPEGMIITTKDYLDHYSSAIVQEFLEDLFNRKFVLFLGYGLEEVELLEYVFRKGKISADNKATRRYILQGFFNAEHRLSTLLGEYFYQVFGVGLINFPKDPNRYEQQIDIFEAWSKSLQFGDMALADEVSVIEDEIGG